MSDNNENNIDETLDNTNVQADAADAAGATDAADAAQTDALADDGITEEEVGTGDDSADGVTEDANTEEAQHTVSMFPDSAAQGGLAEKLASLTKQQLATIGVIGVVIVAVIVAIIVLAVSGKKTESNNVSTTQVSAVTQASTTVQATSEEATTIPVVEPETEVSFDELSQTNEDIYAYIYIPGTEINYPILQSDSSRGENYYMNYTVNNYYAWYGALYTQYTYNSKDFTDKNTIIYGHSASRNINSVMFTQLHYYEDAEFFKTYPYVYIYIGDRQLKYQIFAAANFTDVLIPSKYGVTDGAAMVQFVNDVKTTYGGVIDDSVTIDTSSTIITLETCTMYPDYDESKRFVVLAKLIEEAVVQQ